MRRGLGSGREGGSGGPWARPPLARWALALAGAALLIAAALAGPARPLLAQEASGTAATDRAALMALYQATGGANWTVNTNWGSSAPLGAWHGVTVSAQGRVTHLSLSANNLIGGLPDELGDLDALTYLSLEGNRLRGPIPAALGDLAALESLALGGNGLSREIPDELGRLTRLQLLSLADNLLRGPLPDWLGDLTELQYLALDSNDLTGTLPAALGNLADLREIDLSDNRLSGRIPATLGNLAELQYLALDSNQLSGAIPAALGGLAELEDLHLDGNRLTGPIPAALGSLPHLYTLRLQGNSLSGEIPAALGGLANLQQLWLGRNQLSGEIPAALGGLAHLTDLRLESNRLSGAIPAALGDLASLTALDLGGNRLEGTIPAELGALSALKFIRLAPNAVFTGCIPHGLRALLAVPVPEDAPPAHDFSSLVLPFCLLRDLQFSDVTLEPPFTGGTTPFIAVTNPAAAYSAAVPGSVTETVVTAALYDPRDELTIHLAGTIYASGDTLPLSPGPNRITIEVAPADEALPIPEFVVVTVTRGTEAHPVPQDAGGAAADRAALLALYAATDGPNWTANANWGGDAPLGSWQGVTTAADGRVISLTLAHNNLAGTVPAALGDLADLAELDLGGNRLIGGIPAALGGLHDLAELDLHDNRLSGSLPAALGGLISLETLDLFGNRLSGEIPAALGDLAELETLALGGNRLHGAIPAALGGLAELETLALGGNRLRGVIPPALGGLADLEILDLRANRLHGPLPAALGGLTDLEVLDLGDNRLDGPLPAAWSDLIDLEELDLGGNRLDGPLPAWLGDLSHLERLDLRGNRLIGEIPAALGDLADLRVIRLAGNALSGCIPHGLRDLPATDRGEPAHDLSDLGLLFCAPPDPPATDGGELARDLSDPSLPFCLPPDPPAADGGEPARDLSDPGLPFCLLRDLQLTDAVLDPPFSAGRGAYSAAVGRSVTEIVLTAALHDDDGAVTIRKDGQDYASGDALPLDIGPNVITVVAVPADGTPAQSVTVTVTRLTVDPITLHLREGGGFVAVPAGAATTAADLFGGTDVGSVWQYNRATRAFDRSYRPDQGREDFPITGGDVLWVVAPRAQTLTVAGTPVLHSGPITLVLREGGDYVAVPAGTPTTAADLFGGTDVTRVRKYNRATRAWDLSYVPAQDSGGFAIAPGDVLWVVAPRAQTVGG